MTQQSVNMTELLPSIQTAMFEPYPEVVTAIQCIRAEGLKTALVTNNWLMENGKSFCPVDVEHFDVVSSLFYVVFFSLTSKHCEPVFCLLSSCWKEQEQLLSWQVYNHTTVFVSSFSSSSSSSCSSSAFSTSWPTLLLYPCCPSPHPYPFPSPDSIFLLPSFAPLTPPPSFSNTSSLVVFLFVCPRAL